MVCARDGEKTRGMIWTGWSGTATVSRSSPSLSRYLKDGEEQMISHGRKELHAKKVTYAKALGHKRLNVQMDDGQTVYKNRIDL